MPEDYIYRTTTQDMLQEDSKKVDLFKHDLYKLEQELGHNDIEMYIRQMKMELRCARSLADEQPWGEIFAPAPTDQWKWPI
jgi:deoxyribodipyrimidine photolyase